MLRRIVSFRLGVRSYSTIRLKLMAFYNLASFFFCLWFLSPSPFSRRHNLLALWGLSFWVFNWPFGRWALWVTKEKLCCLYHSLYWLEILINILLGCRLVAQPEEVWQSTLAWDPAAIAILFNSGSTTEISVSTRQQEFFFQIWELVS